MLPLINESLAHRSLIKEVEKIIENYDGEAVPARNIEVDYVPAWMYFPHSFFIELN